MPLSSAMASLAPFLNGVSGRLAHSMPQLEDEASAIDMRKEMKEEEEQTESKTVRQIKIEEEG